MLDQSRLVSLLLARRLQCLADADAMLAASPMHLDQRILVTMALPNGGSSERRVALSLRKDRAAVKRRRYKSHARARASLLNRDRGSSVRSRRAFSILRVLTRVTAVKIYVGVRRRAPLRAIALRRRLNREGMSALQRRPNIRFQKRIRSARVCSADLRSCGIIELIRNEFGGRNGFSRLDSDADEMLDRACKISVSSEEISR